MSKRDLTLLIRKERCARHFWTLLLVSGPKLLYQSLQMKVWLTTTESYNLRLPSWELLTFVGLNLLLTPIVDSQSRYTVLNTCSMHDLKSTQSGSRRNSKSPKFHRSKGKGMESQFIIAFLFYLLKRKTTLSFEKNFYPIVIEFMQPRNLQFSNL